MQCSWIQFPDTTSWTPGLAVLEGSRGDAARLDRVIHDTRTGAEGMLWALLVLRWVLHQIPHHGARCSPVSCFVTGLAAGSSQ
jgi:hypothetical protein